MNDMTCRVEANQAASLCRYQVRLLLYALPSTIDASTDRAEALLAAATFPRRPSLVLPPTVPGPSQLTSMFVAPDCAASLKDKRRPED